MKHLTVCGLLVFIVLEFGTVRSVPVIKHEDKMCTLRPSNDICVYQAKKEVKVTCENGQRWGPVTQELDNTTLPEAKFEIVKDESKQPLTMTIKYFEPHFVKLLKVRCWSSEDSTASIIEQQYPTAIAQLQSSTHPILQSGIFVDAGQTVSLECVADGNPDPEFEWSSKNATGHEVQLPDGNQGRLEITTIEDQTITEEYRCRAKNTINKVPSLWKETAWLKVTSVYVPPPVIEPKSPSPSEQTPTKLTFKEKTKVTLKCPFPTNPLEDIEYKMDARIVQDNPVFPSKRLQFQTTVSEQDISLTISYDALKFVSLVNVSCSALSRTSGVTKATTQMQIEMQYPTKNTAIKEGAKVKVAPGTNITLTCLADGNPLPEYQWYNKTLGGDVPLAQARQPAFDLSVPMKWSTSAFYFCSANNTLNKGKVSSPPTEVSAIYVPPPTIATITVPETGSPAPNITYVEKSRVLLNCFLPLPVMKDIELQTGYQIIEENPVFPGNQLKLISVDKDTPQYTEFAIETTDQMFAPSISVSCRAQNRTSGKTEATSVVFIEQKFKTMHAKIKEPSKSVDAGSKVSLTCLADGNPLPQHQWYKQPKSGTTEQIPEATHNVVELTVPANETSVVSYFCSAWNDDTMKPINSSLVTVTGRYFPPPSFNSTTTTNSMDSNPLKYTYLEKTKVIVNCFAPPTPTAPDTQLAMDYEHLQDNPVFRLERTKFKKTEGTKVIQLEIEYNEEKIVPRVQVTCTAKEKNTGAVKNSAVLQIEQKYATQNVMIQPSPKVTLHPQEEVTLTCVADGNPAPKYQWYKMAQNEPVEMKNVTSPVLQLQGQAELRKDQYRCSAWNVHNEYHANSTTVEVSVVAAGNPVDGNNGAAGYHSVWLLFLVLPTMVVMATV